MLILCEGPDGAGKTTLVNRLVEAITTANPGDTVQLWRAGVPPRHSHPLDLYEKPLLDYRADTGHHIVCDRWHLGEWVYPAILGRDTRADDPSWLHLDMFLASRGALVVYLDTPVATLHKTITERGDDLVLPAQVGEISVEYERVLKSSRLPIFRTGRDNPFAVAEIIPQARALEAEVAPLRDYVTYVGPPKPRYLILGDVRHELSKVDLSAVPACATRRYGPAFGPHPATSGHYLLSHLPLRILDAGVGLANACDVDDIRALRAELDWPAVAALGVNAFRKLFSSITGTEPNLQVLTQMGAAPHPQYVRRFHHKHGFAYGEVVASALQGTNELAWRP